MNEFIKKLIERLEDNYRPIVTNDEDLEWNRAVYSCTEIVNQLAEEYSKDQNWQTTRNHLDEKYFSKIRELSAKYNYSCENVPINFDWVFGLIEKMEKAAAVEDSGWIPCSERLPEEANDYLVTQYNADAVDDFCDGYRINKIFYDSDWWDNIDASFGWKIIAWQLLPEAYQPEGE